MGVEEPGGGEGVWGEAHIREKTVPSTLQKTCTKTKRKETAKKNKKNTTTNAIASTPTDLQNQKHKKAKKKMLAPPAATPPIGVYRSALSNESEILQHLR